MNVSVTYDLPPPDLGASNGSASPEEEVGGWYFFACVQKKDSSFLPSNEEGDDASSNEEEDDDDYDYEYHDDEDDGQEWKKDERMRNATIIDVPELIEMLYENDEINVNTSRSKSYALKIIGHTRRKDTFVIFYRDDDDDEEQEKIKNVSTNTNDMKTKRGRNNRRRREKRSTYVPFYVAHVLRRLGHIGPIKVLLKKRGGEVASKEEKKSSSSSKSANENSGILYDERIVSLYDLLQNLTTQRLQVIDTRSKAFFRGKVQREKTLAAEKDGGGDRAGHIPNSINVPHSRLRPFDDKHNTAVFEDHGVDLSAPCAVIGGHFCSSAPFVAAMLENLGVRDVFIVESGMHKWRSKDGGSYPLYNPSEMNSATGRVIVWSVTRGRSTALERAFAQHPKIMVMHELLTEPYLKENTPANYEKIKNGQQTLNVSSSGCSYLAVMELMMTDYSSQGKSYFLSKELSCYFDKEKCTNEWLQSFNHVILVRNPSDALKSFYRIGLNNRVAESLYFDPSESGFKECQKIVETLDSIKGKYMVVDADIDLMSNPEETLKQVCAFASIPFNRNMLSWEAKELDSWKKFRGWHTDAINSTCFKQPSRSASFEMEYPKEVLDAIEEAMPSYTFCLKRR